MKTPNPTPSIEIKGFRNVAEIMAMNARLDGIMKDGVDTETSLEGMRDQLGFLISTLEASRSGLTRLAFDETGMIYGMIRTLREAIAVSEEFQQEQQGFSDEIQQAIDMA